MKYEVVSLLLLNLHCVAKTIKSKCPYKLLIWVEAVKWNIGKMLSEENENKIVATEQKNIRA